MDPNVAPKRAIRKYQVWVQHRNYVSQDGTSPRGSREWELHTDTDEHVEAFLALERCRIQDRESFAAVEATQRVDYNLQLIQ